MKTTANVFKALAYAREEATPLLMIGKPGSGASALARSIGQLYAPLRAPHYTAGANLLVQEIALAAGGVLHFDEAHEFSTDALRVLFCTWQRMVSNPAQPILLLRVHDADGRRRIEGLLDDCSVHTPQCLEL